MTNQSKARNNVQSFAKHHEEDDILKTVRGKLGNMLIIVIKDHLQEIEGEYVEIGPKELMMYSHVP